MFSALLRNFSTPELDWPLEVRRTRRKKTTAIKIAGDTVIVSVPRFFSDRQVQQLLHKHQHWIQQKLHENSNRPALPPKKFIQDEAFLFLDKHYLLTLNTGKNRPLELTETGFVIGFKNPPEADRHLSVMQNRFVSWYKKQAVKLFAQRIAYYKPVMQVHPKEILIKTYRARWGSCSSKGVVSFNWKLLMAPAEVIDYVVVHELAHLIHHNHSADFWECVSRYMPDYKTQRNWLKQNGYQLNLK